MRTRRGKLAAASLVLAAVVALLTSMRWVAYSGHDPIGYLVAGAQALRWLLALLAVVALVLAMVSWRRLAMLLAGLLVVGHCVIAGPSFVSNEAITTVPGTPFTVLSSNLLLLKGDVASLLPVVRERKVEVLVLVEAGEDVPAQLTASGLDTLLPHRLGTTQNRPKGTLILSKWPLTALAPVPSRQFPQPRAVVHTPHGDVVVTAVHAASPMTPPDRASDLTMLAGVLDAASRTDRRPHVVLGDFNASADTAQFRPLLDHFVDVHEALGQGFVPTWPAGAVAPPFVQIDHVLVRGLGANAAGSVEVPHSDHRAVWATLTIPATT